MSILRTSQLSLLIAFPLAAGLGCTSDTEPGPDPEAGCVPSSTEWAADIQPLVQASCGSCHGAEPAFGAPFTLLEYQSLLEGAEGERIVDRMHVQLSAGTMPPVGSPVPSLEDANRITQWASCGTVTVDRPANATRPAFVAPEQPPEGLEVIDVVVTDFTVGADQLNVYEERDFTNLTDEDVFIRRFEAVIDDSRVLHHLTLRRGDPALGDGNLKYLYAWAPGTGAIEFPDGGVRLRPGDNLRLQIHYNNAQGLADVSDSSGVRLYVGPPEGSEYEMSDPGPGSLGFNIPARSAETVENTCEISEDVRVIATMPHMHEVGAAFDLLVQKPGGEQASVLELFSWDFDSQIFYDLPINLEAGDLLTVKCDFDNTTSSVVSAGPRTEDEMCFAFTYVTPPPSSTLCRSLGVTTLEYMPGACISDPLTDVPEASVSVVEDVDAPVFDEAGTFPTGPLVLDRLVVATPEPGVVGLATFSAAGQATRMDNTVALDAAVHLVAPTPSLSNGVQNDFQVAGDLANPAGASALALTCPEPADIPLLVGTVDGQAAARFEAGAMPVETVLWFFFSPAE